VSKHTKNILEFNFECVKRKTVNWDDLMCKRDLFVIRWIIDGPATRAIGVCTSKITRLKYLEDQKCN